MEQLTKSQFRLLKKLANGKTKRFAALTGIESDRNPDAINLEFNEVCRLVQLRLVGDVTHEHPEDVELHAKQGRDFIVVHLLNRGTWMFERVPWDKWVN